MKLKSKVTAVKKEKSYGSLSLNSSDYPEISKCSVGDIKEFDITVKVKGLRQPDMWEVSEENAKPTDVIANVIITSIKHKSSKEGAK